MEEVAPPRPAPRSEVNKQDGVAKEDVFLRLRRLRQIYLDQRTACGRHLPRVLLQVSHNHLADSDHLRPHLFRLHQVSVWRGALLPHLHVLLLLGTESSEVCDENCLEQSASQVTQTTYCSEPLMYHSPLYRRLLCGRMIHKAPQNSHFATTTSQPIHRPLTTSQHFTDCHRVLQCPWLVVEWLSLYPSRSDIYTLSLAVFGSVTKLIIPPSFLA
ncbi:hypothetical protein E2C01_028042 [Portunus trituberculatus]|uniref:Uncharacterized protein n=1 Tax=Portunus trituberculatus TaxID=210409 RepID=A0A5B7EN61_PORTR|nr:hypothetical protein [Portunus trituberculatus]